MGYSIPPSAPQADQATGATDEGHSNESPTNRADTFSAILAAREAAAEQAAARARAAGEARAWPRLVACAACALAHAHFARWGGSSQV